MRIRIVCTLTLVLSLLAPAAARAHFLWFLTKPYGEAPRAEVYFSETAAPDNPEFLDRVASAEAWALVGPRGNEPKLLKLERKGESLVAELPRELRDAPVVMKHTYGVTSRGGETFRLNYYAKSYPTALPGTWKSVKNAALLPLEVVPAMRGGKIELTVLWQEKPLAGALVTVEAASLEKKLEGTTDDAGIFRCDLPDSGVYSIRARYIEEKPGELDGQSYKTERHYSTLALRFIPAQMKSVAHSLTPLAKGTTSFGGAVAGDWLYVYGGHYGAAHQYSQDGQSGDFARLNLRDPKAWESLPGGPKLTGLAMVAHGGTVYRIGGFTAKNAETDSESLWSQPDFARFDPATGQWTNLAPLPEGRSSHDAAVVGNMLYVVGGWTLAGSDPTRWHDTAWSFDLADAAAQWKPVASPPFHRRALALAAHQNKLYCIGGMQERGGTVLSVAVYDPAKNAWSEGPDLLGSGMDGFGASAFASGGALYATTMSGAIQRLSPAGDAWEFVTQLERPRFFHRLLSWHDDRLVVVGGASMTSGKVLSLELLAAPQVQAAAR